jgi:hypothetical protein
MARTAGRASARNLEALAHRLEAAEGRISALEAENKALRQYGGRSRAMAMTAIVGLAAVEVHVGLAKPRRKKRVPGFP